MWSPHRTFHPKTSLSVGGLHIDSSCLISSTRSCCVTPSKHRLLQHSRASPVSITWHDPEAECGSPDRCKNGEEEQIRPRIGQSVSNRGEDHTIFDPFRPL